MEAILEKINELNRLIEQFRYDEALDKFYDDDLVTCENEEPPIIGLAAYREAGKKFQDSISNYRAKLKNVLISDQMSVVEWHYQFDHAALGKWDKRQLSVQRWKNGKIIHERHHWNP